LVSSGTISTLDTSDQGDRINYDFANTLYSSAVAEKAKDSAQSTMTEETQFCRALKLHVSDQAAGI